MWSFDLKTSAWFYRLGLIIANKVDINFSAFILIESKHKVSKKTNFVLGISRLQLQLSQCNCKVHKRNNWACSKAFSFLNLARHGAERSCNYTKLALLYQHIFFTFWQWSLYGKIRLKSISLRVSIFSVLNTFFKVVSDHICWLLEPVLLEYDFRRNLKIFV